MDGTIVSPLGEGALESAGVQRRLVQFSAGAKPAARCKPQRTTGLPWRTTAFRSASLWTCKGAGRS